MYIVIPVYANGAFISVCMFMYKLEALTTIIVMQPRWSISLEIKWNEGWGALNVGTKHV